MKFQQSVADPGFYWKYSEEKNLMVKLGISRFKRQEYNQPLVLPIPVSNSVIKNFSFEDRLGRKDIDIHNFKGR